MENGQATAALRLLYHVYIQHYVRGAELRVYTAYRCGRQRRGMPEWAMPMMRMRAPRASRMREPRAERGAQRHEPGAEARVERQRCASPHA